MSKSFFSSLLVIFCFVLFETAIVSNLNFLPASPDFLLIIILYISLNNGILLGETTGFCSGLMLDFLTGSPVGFNALLRTILGFIAGFFHNVLNDSSFFLQILYGFVATLVKAFFIFLLSVFFKGVQSYPFFSFVFLTEIILNSIFTPLMFMFLNLFSDFLLLKPEKNI